MGFSVLRIWPIFGSVFRFSLLKIAVFRFWCFVRFADFLQFSLRFSVFVNNDGGFSDSSAQFIYGFSGFAKDFTPCSHAKTVIPRDHLQLEECMTSLVSLAAVIWVVICCQAARRRYVGYNFCPKYFMYPFQIRLPDIVVYLIHYNRDTYTMLRSMIRDTPSTYHFCWVCAGWPLRAPTPF